MLSHFLKNFVRKKELAYYEVNLNHITIATLGDEGLEKALRVINRITAQESPPTIFEELPWSTPDLPSPITISREDVTAHASGGEISLDVSTGSIDAPSIGRADPTPPNLLHEMAAQVQRAMEESERRMSAKFEQLIEATKPEGDCLLSEAKKDFMARGSLKKKNPKTVREFHFFFKSFIDIVGDKKLSEYRYADTTAYAEALRLLPKYPHLNRAFDNCNYKEMIEVGKTINAPVIGISTQQRHIKILKSVFHWCADKFNLRRDASEGIDMLQYVRSDEQAGQPFSTSDLKKIFNHALVLKYKSPDQYWGPLISLFTGMRVNEIAQMYTTDIVEEEVFDITTGETNQVLCFKVQLDKEGKKSLKSRNAKRTIPVHPKLIELGLCDYLEDLRTRGLKHLLPGLKWGENGPGGEISDWFNKGYIRNKCAIPEDTKTFHSFRNSFETIADRSGISETSLIKLCGYGRGLTIWRVHYIKDATLDECYEAMRKMKFPKLDFMPYHWRQYKDYLDDVEKKAKPEERIPAVFKKPRGRPPKYATSPKGIFTGGAKSLGAS